MKKFVALVLALMLFMPTALAATPAYEDALPGYYKPPLMNEGQYPIQGENLKLTYWMPINGGAAQFIASYEENPAYQKIQENTGVDIEFIHPAVGTEKESFQLMLGQELPDMFLLPSGDYYTGDLQAMYDDGIIIDLTPYLDEYAPQYKEVINYSDMSIAQCYSGGKALGFYKITHAPNIAYIRMNINKDLMLEAGMETEPNTIEEVEAYFQWILDNKEGVVPLYFNPATAAAMNVNVLTGAFDFLKDWYVTKEDNTKVAYWANTPQYKDWLVMMNRWYTKGYLHKDFLSLQESEASAQYCNGQIAGFISSVDACLSAVNQAGNFKVTNIPYLTKEEGQVLGSYIPGYPMGSHGGEYVTVITTACKNPEVAVQYLNYAYTFEGSIVPNWGVEGLTFEWGENNFPYHTDLMNKNPEGQTHSNVGYSLKIHFGAKYCYPDNLCATALLYNPEAYEYRTKWEHLETEQGWLNMPPVKLTSEESAKRAEIMAQVDTYANEMMIKFITGSEPIENFDAYVKAVEEYGLLDAIEITQGAVNRFYGLTK